MIRWTEEQAPVRLASLDSAVLRYDGNGRLIVPARAAPEAGAAEAPDAPFSPESVIAPQDVLPSIRLIAARYQAHPALRRVDLSPKQWAAFFQAMIKVESNYAHGAVSHAGALGLAQLMPDTATDLRVDPADPLENLDGGARYLLQQLAEFDDLELALAAYNAGPNAVRRYRGIPPYAETRSHVGRVMAAYGRILADL